MEVRQQTPGRRPFLLTAGLSVLLAWALVPAFCLAEVAALDEFKALGEEFDHLTTGFALTGEHSLLECGECHIGGVFEALPRECDVCHDNVIAAGMPANHIETTQPCDTCHTTQGFLATAVMDHSLISGVCASCHDGASATGQPPSHITTTSLCDACHSVNIWAPVPGANVNHEHTLGDCVSCHNGIDARGKSVTHIASTDICNSCHLATSGPNWPVDPYVDHAHVLGACSSCHDKPADHIPTQLECNACHVTAPDPWTDAAFNHDTVQGQSCAQSGCHDGASSAQGAPNDTIHANSTDVCGSCHTAGGNFASPVNVDHSQVILPCQTCHDGVTATGKDADHIETTEDCGNCHNTMNFADVIVNSSDNNI
ncbi:MAG: hypothetical protein PVH04_04350 [Gammaproteobacteria bacterium]|jgi:hypothetical protein